MRRTAVPAMLACAGLFACLPGTAAAATGAQIRDSVNRGANWLDGKQQANGTWDTNTVPSALAAAGRNAADVSQPNGTDARTFLQNSLNSSAFTAPTSPADANPQVGVFQRAILESYSAGLDPQRIGPGQNLAAQLAGYYDDGYYTAQKALFLPTARQTSYAIFGALALQRTAAPQFLIDRSVAVIRATQHNDGGWDYGDAATDADRAAPSGTDITGAAIAALCVSGADRSDPDVRQGIDYLKSIQIQSGNAAGGEGGFSPFNSPDADSTGWVISGLNACGIDPQGAEFSTAAHNVTPVDYLRSLQATSGPDNGGFNYDYNDSFGLGRNVFASQDALRALAGAVFSAPPPARTDPTQPRVATPPTVADGTTVPVALAVDNGSGGVTFCRVSVPSGSSLATLLATAASGSAPAGCAIGGEFTGGQLSKLNGQTGTWAYSTGGGEQVAANQAVRFGDFVSLRRTSNAVPAVAGATTPPAAVPAPVQAKTTPTGVTSKSLKVSAKKRVVSVSLTCARDNRSCEGRVYIVYGKSTLGRRAFTIGGGKTTKLNVKLFKSGVKRLGGKKRSVKINTFSRDGAGIASTSSRTVTLTPTK